MRCLLFVVAVVLVEGTSFDDYQRERNTLIAADTAMGIDHHHLDVAEKAANTVLLGLKDAEINRTAGAFPPQYSFLKTRNEIDESEVLAVLRKMPKGGLLHVHADGMVRPSFWIEKTYLPGCYMFVLQNSSVAVNTIHFFSSPPTERGWVAMEELRHASGNATAFDEELLTKLSIVGFEGSDLEEWQRFEAGFSCLKGLFNYLPVFKEYQRRTMELFVSDGVYHVENRLTLPGMVPQLYDDERVYSVEETVAVIHEVLAAFRLEHPYFSMVVILCDIRANDADTVAASLKTVYGIRSRFPSFVVGFDLVGEEDLGHSLLYFVPTLFRVQDEMAARGLPAMQYFFHAGETDWQTVSENLFDAILLNTTRIGHGFALAKHPELMSLVRILGTAVEVCPISNQLLGLVGDLRDHPAAVMLSLDLPVTINSDGPGLWDLGDVSHDWYLAFMAWDLDLAGLKQLATNSIRYSALSTLERARLFRHWRAAWAQWVTAVAALHA